MARGLHCELQRMQNPVAGRKLSSSEQVRGSSVRLGVCSPERHCHKPPHQPVGGLLLLVTPMHGSICPDGSVFMRMRIFSLWTPASRSSLVTYYTSLLVCIMDMDRFSLRASLSFTSPHKPRWHFMCSPPPPLSFPSTPLLIFSSRSPHSGSSVSKRDFTFLIWIFQSIAQQSRPKMAGLGLLP